MPRKAKKTDPVVQRERKAIARIYKEFSEIDISIAEIRNELQQLKREKVVQNKLKEIAK